MSLNTLDISETLVEAALSNFRNSSIIQADKRGKYPNRFKTIRADIKDGLMNHIKCFSLSQYTMYARTQEKCIQKKD